MEQGAYEALKVEIDNIKDDIKEIKLDQKETNKYYRDVIGELKENAIRQTEILNNQEKQFKEVNNDIDSLNSDISGIRNDIDDKLNNQTKWYQDFINNNFGIVFKVLVALVLILAGFKLAGFNFESLFGL